MNGMNILRAMLLEKAVLHIGPIGAIEGPFIIILKARLCSHPVEELVFSEPDDALAHALDLGRTINGGPCTVIAHCCTLANGGR